jgi:HAD superfamily hydrolase (TIGR01509 family)
MSIKGAIFDLDGTLLDSMPLWNNFGQYYLQTRGIVSPAGLGETLKAMSLLQAARYFREHFGFVDTETEILIQFNDLLAMHYRDRIVLKPQVYSFLKRLKEAGVKLCIATATDRNLAQAALQRLGIIGCFEFILTCADVCCGKDEPLIFLRSLDMLGTKKEETIVFEDALYAIKTAKEAGFLVAGVFDESAKADADEIKILTNYYINSFEEWELVHDEEGIINRRV